MSENVDKMVDKAVKAGGTPMGPVGDMFWGDRCGVVADLDGYTWMVATHVAEPTPQEMAKAQKEMAKAQKVSSAGPTL
jgi:PhnB protein